MLCSHTIVFPKNIVLSWYIRVQTVFVIPCYCYVSGSERVLHKTLCAERVPAKLDKNFLNDVFWGPDLHRHQHPFVYFRKHFLQQFRGQNLWPAALFGVWSSVSSEFVAEGSLQWLMVHLQEIVLTCLDNYHGNQCQFCGNIWFVCFALHLETIWSSLFLSFQRGSLWHLDRRMRTTTCAVRAFRKIGLQATPEGTKRKWAKYILGFRQKYVVGAIYKQASRSQFHFICCLTEKLTIMAKHIFK